MEDNKREIQNLINILNLQGETIQAYKVITQYNTYFLKLDSRLSIVEKGMEDIEKKVDLILNTLSYKDKDTLSCKDKDTSVLQNSLSLQNSSVLQNSLSCKDKDTSVLQNRDKKNIEIIEN